MQLETIANNIKLSLLTHKPVLIGIEGYGGSGKSTIAIRLAELLGNAFVINIDDFSIKENIIENDRDKQTFDRQRLEDQVLLPASKGEQIKYVKHLWNTNSLTDPVIVPPVDYLIIEGISAHHLSIAHYYDHKVWVDTPIEIAKARGEQRDTSNENEQHWDLWLSDDLKYQEKYHPEKVADFIVSNQTSSFDKIGPTAWLVAYRRTFTDILLSQEIFDEVEALRKQSSEPELAKELFRSGSAPQFEARYKLVDRILKQIDIKQILELASGLSPRGLNTSKEGITYVEVDLPSMMDMKRTIAEKLYSDYVVKHVHNLYLENGDVLNMSQLEHAARHFDINKPLAVINEGLMRYLNFDQKRILASNIHGLLSKFGGIWINPDISLRKTQENEDLMTAGHIKRISKMVGVDIAANSFENEARAKTFFEELGFSVERYSYLEVTDKLTSVKRLNTSQEDLIKLNGDAVVFVMRVTGTPR